MEQAIDRVEFMARTRPDIATEIRHMGKAIYDSDALDLKTKELSSSGSSRRSATWSLRCGRMSTRR